MDVVDRVTQRNDIAFRAPFADIVSGIGAIVAIARRILNHRTIISRAAYYSGVGREEIAASSISLCRISINVDIIFAVCVEGCGSD
jgi:hypothetical protein